MRRILLAAVLAAAVVPGPARADFHLACGPTPAAVASVDLLAASDPYYGTVWTYSGTVTCAGVASISSTVTLGMVNPATLTVSTIASAFDSCSSTCPVTFIVEDSTPAVALPRYLEVRMTFSVPDFPNVVRSGRWLWLGAGVPIPAA